ncbi:tRNA (guanine(26)-N(2))-dimethyltransferase isoform X2 [Panicum hallii]|uniref:tRNA (guanine(26)-N(2))-dimethyltransferase isoform X2 n=1 Tax=Panicum hallii TaxID=206008 RepID=UPI000DF4CB53|nr:tRNA (guanine(26)-N(2))-dimethyltransferase isoform X2 [Panicum hallii]
MAAAATAISLPHSVSPPLQVTRRRPAPPACSHSERGVSFDPGSAFYRSDSAAGRDLAILAATLHRRHGRLDPSAPFLCLDAMCGCGVRALRYLAQAGADFVWANDANEALRPIILTNLSRFERGSPPAEAGRRRWVVSHNDATRLLAERYLRREYFDVIDVDSFGGDAAYVRAALLALKIGGLLYLTSTDWRSARGYGSRSSLSSYGAYVRPMPYPNEVGLRMVIGGAAREAALLGFHIRPVFSYFAYHGPIYRVMVQLCNGKDNDSSNYGFISHCKSCGQSQTFGFDELGRISCGCTDRTVGPLWTGPLHDASFLTEMRSLADEWGWAYTSENGVTLEKLLSMMIEESDPRLPPGYIRLDEISRRAKVNSPPLSTLINSLRKEGFSACRSHIGTNVIKTNCPISSCINVAREIRNLR